MRPAHSEPPPLSAGDVTAYAWWVFLLTAATLTIAAIALTDDTPSHPSQGPATPAPTDSCGSPSPTANPSPPANTIP